MATTNKNFKVKHGLIVEGSVATVNGNQVLTEDASDQYIIDLIGGETLVTSVESTQMEVVAGELNIKSGVFDPAGSASTAETNANTYTDTALEDYTPTASLDTTVGGYGYLKNADLPTMYSDSDVDAHLSGGDGITYSTGTISADVAGGLEITAGQIVVDRTTTDTWYDASGAAGDVASDLSTHEGLTSGVHGTTGSVVGTTDIQDLSNKTIIDTLSFSDGVTVAQEGEIAVKAGTHEFEVKANDGDLHLITVKAGADVLITSDTGDIVLNADGTAYYGSASAENEIATHGYVDNAISGLDWKQAVNLLAHTSIALTGDATSTSIDGHSLASANGYRVLLTGQTTDSEKGIYDLDVTSGTYTLTRAADADVYTELIGAAVYVMEGTTYGATSWVQSDHYLTDFTSQEWTQFSGQGSVTAGTGIVVDGLEVSVDFTVVAEVQDLTDGLALKQDELTAGSNIDITGATISVTGLTSAEISDFNTAALSATSAAYDIAGAAATAESNANGYTDTALGSYTTTANLENTIDGYGFAYTSEIPTSSDDLSEGVSNLFYTDGRAEDAAGNLLANATKSNINISYVGGVLDIAAEDGVADSTTFDLAEDPAGSGTSGTWYFTNERAVDALEAVVPNFTAIEVDGYAKQIASNLFVATASVQTAYAFDKTVYRSGKFLIKTAYGTHTELTEVLLTLDSGDNIAITEYATIGTNGSSMSVTADVSGSDVRIRVTTVNNDSDVTVYGTLLK
jgi:hypothetical protein